MESLDYRSAYWLTGDRTNDPVLQRLKDGADEPGRRQNESGLRENESGVHEKPGSAGSPGPSTAPLPTRWPAGHRRPAIPASRRWPGKTAPPARHLPVALRRWAVAVGLGAGVLAIVIAGVILIPSQHHSTVLAGSCGMTRCTSTAPRLPRTALPPTAAPSGTVRAHRAPTPSATPTLSASALPAPPRASASPTPRPSRTPPAQTPSPTVPRQAVSVSYSLVQQWGGGFQGDFTIANHGRTAISGRELSAALPGDQIDSAWDANYHTSGDVMIIDPPSYQETIAPGASLTEYFTANGTTTGPASCTFSGAPC